MVSVFIANTDNDWFDFLSSEPGVTEVNFWRPSSKAFHALTEGELFVFRLKSPRNKIGGFGVFSGGSRLPLQVAWEAFGRSNGAPSYAALRDAIASYIPDATVGPATHIGCRILVQPTFLPPSHWIDLPPSWSSSIQGGKVFSTDNSEGRRLWEQLLALSKGWPDHPFAGISEPPARYGEPTLIAPRLGQGAFRIAVTEAYGRQCAISGGKVLPALDAAHIRPFADEGPHTKSNGILLRKDIHCVFDSGYATVDPDYRFLVSTKVKEIFDNGEEYRRLHGKQLILPRLRSDWPDPEFLRWHNDTRFLG